MRKTTLIIFIFIALFTEVACAGNFRAAANERTVNIKLAWKFAVEGHVKSIRIKMVVPRNIKDRQTINKLTYSTEPDSIYERNGNMFALFMLHDIEEDFTISIKANISIYRLIPGSNESPDTNLTRYLIAEPFIESDDPKIIAVAKTLERKTDIETVIATFSYVKEHIIYKLKEEAGAGSVLESGEGKCMDFSDLMNALLRANHIPAKSMHGMVLTNEGGPGFHAWSEVYLKKQGWIVFDPTTGQSDIYADGNNYKMQIANKYVILEDIRNDPEVNLRKMKCRYYLNPGSSIKVKSKCEISAEW